jgi:hypothetical protein
MPVGPNAPVHDVQDTLDSVAYYLPEAQIVITDNSDQGLGEQAAESRPKCTVIRTSEPKGAWGALWVNQSKGIRYALDNLSFDILLKLDDDALVVGHGLGAKAREIFDRHPKVAILGAYQYDWDGSVRNIEPAAYMLHRELGVIGLLNPRKRKQWLPLRRLYAQAKQHGYVDGEHCFGASAVFRKDFLQQLHPLLGEETFASSRLGEDQLFGLMAKADGWSMHDFATGDMPLALAWRGMPCEPDDLPASKLLIHSVRGRPDVREYFRQRRT